MQSDFLKLLSAVIHAIVNQSKVNKQQILYKWYVCVS